MIRKNKRNVSRPDDTLEKPTPLTERIEKGIVNKIGSHTGIFHTKGPSLKLEYIGAPNEHVIKNDGSYIVLGTDRPHNVESGTGALVSQGAFSIDSVVGRMAAANGGKGPKPGTLVANSFQTDAARIYISQLTDMDHNFGTALCFGDPGYFDPEGVGLPRSGIGIKADLVRVIGREGVKIVTGPMTNTDGPRETNSLGGKLAVAPPIHLIAGNNVTPREVNIAIPTGNQSHGLATATIETLQPVLLGGNTENALTDLVELIGEIWASLYALALLQAGYNSVVGIDPLRSWVAAAAPTTLTPQMTNVINTLWHSRTNLLCWRLNYLEQSGYKSIQSANVSTT